MPPAHKFDFYFPSRPSNSRSAELNGKGDATKRQREENNHHKKPGNPTEGSRFMFEGSTDKKDEANPARSEEPLRAPHILNRVARERLLLAINKAPTNQLRQAFQALVSSVDDIPEGVYRMLGVTENAGRPQVPQQSVNSAGEDPSHRQGQLEASAASVHEGGRAGVTNARGHLQILGPAKINPGAHPEPYGNLPGVAPYVRPPPPPLHHWPVPQPQPQSLPQVPQRELRQNPAAALGGRFRAVNFSYQAMGPPAHAPHDGARHALGQAHSTQAIGRTQCTFTNRYGGTYAIARSNVHGHASAYTPPVPLAGVAHAPDPQRAVFVPVPLRQTPPSIPVPRLVPASWAPASADGLLDAHDEVAICENCRKEYDASEERLQGECRYHSGILDTKEDTTNRQHILADTHANRMAHPERFVWTCRDRDVTRMGCEQGVHVPQPGTGQRGTKRARIE